MQIQVSWLLQKPTDLDLHYLQSRVYLGLAGQGLRISISCFVFFGDNLHEMLMPGKNKKNIMNLSSSAEFAQRVVKINVVDYKTVNRRGRNYSRICQNNDPWHQGLIGDLYFLGC